ncbi:MAG: hypothetical protein GY851_35490 [bacterium]|nr:hypothetical protein [bacterium]
MKWRSAETRAYELEREYGRVTALEQALGNARVYKEQGKPRRVAYWQRVAEALERTERMGDRQ